jgi:uncharacterized membrane protein
MLVLLGIVVVVAGFLARQNPLLVVVVAALVTGVLGAITAGAPLAPGPLWEALVHTVGLLGKAFNKNRYITVVWMILPLIGLLEREGLQERARLLIGRVKAATVGSLLMVYFIIRQVTAACGLTSMLGQAQTVRPLLAPMAEAALEKQFGAVPDTVRYRARAWAAAADNVAVFYGEDIFLAIGAVLLVVATMENFGVKVSPLQVSLWAIPTAICALVVHGTRLLLLDRRLAREVAAHKAEAGE